MSTDPFKVGDPYRTNPLSVEAGGVTVMVEQIDGKILVYDKIKAPWAYIREVKKNPQVKNAWVSKNLNDKNK